MNTLIKTFGKKPLTRANNIIGGSLRVATFATQGHFYDILQLDEMRSDLRESVEQFADAEVKPLRES